MANDHQLAYASFSIYQDAEPPEFWTRYFGIEPDMQSTKGQFRVLPSGRVSDFPARIGVWNMTSKASVHSDRLEPHLRYVAGRLALPRADLPELLRRTRAQMRFFCYWDNESGDRTPDVPDDIKAMMEEMGGTIEIDEHK